MLVQRLLKSPAHSAPAPLLSTELFLLASQRTLYPLLPFSKHLPQLAAKYTSSPKGKPNARVWLARLEVESASSGDASRLKAVCKEARAAVQGDGVVDVWLWGVNTDDVHDEESAHETLRSLEVMSNIFSIDMSINTTATV
jgi:hypothetical protein